MAVAPRFVWWETEPTLLCSSDKELEDGKRRGRRLPPPLRRHIAITSSGLHPRRFRRHRGIALAIGGRRVASKPREPLPIAAAKL